MNERAPHRAGHLGVPGVAVSARDDVIGRIRSKVASWLRSVTPNELSDAPLVHAGTDAARETHYLDHTPCAGQEADARTNHLSDRRCPVRPARQGVDGVLQGLLVPQNVTNYARSIRHERRDPAHVHTRPRQRPAHW